MIFYQQSLQDDELASEIRHLRFLVLDEADRMIEAGHFAELENILRLTLLEAKYAVFRNLSNSILTEHD